MSTIVNPEFVKAALVRSFPAEALEVMAILEGSKSPLDVPEVLDWASSVEYHPSGELQVWKAVCVLLKTSLAVAIDPWNGGAVMYVPLAGAEVLAYSSAYDSFNVLRTPNLFGDVWLK